MAVISEKIFYNLKNWSNNASKKLELSMRTPRPRQNQSMLTVIFTLTLIEKSLTMFFSYYYYNGLKFVKKKYKIAPPESFIAKIAISIWFWFIVRKNYEPKRITNQKVFAHGGMWYV